MDVSGLLSAFRLHARLDDDANEDAGLELMLKAAAEDVAHAAAYTLPETVIDLPEDLRFAVVDQATRTYDARGVDDVKPGLSLAASRIVHRYRGVSVGITTTTEGTDA